MAKEPAEKQPTEETRRKTCGLVMPISERDGVGVEHWLEVQEIIKEALMNVPLHIRLVSESLTADVIHKRIVHNLFNDDICVCDISTMNPNVMFELGIRLAFQRPVVVVKDDQTKDPFDTGIIRYVEYPRSLRHKQVQTFAVQLRDAVNEALNPKPGDEQFSFLKAVGPIDVPRIEAKDVQGFEYVSRQIDELRSLIVRRETSRKDMLLRRGMLDDIADYVVETARKDARLLRLWRLLDSCEIEAEIAAWIKTKNLTDEEGANMTAEIVAKRLFPELAG